MRKKVLKDIIKICVFIALANLPFITITQLIGMDTFLDSFENPEHYHYVQNSEFSMEPNTKDEDYTLLQISSHPTFTIEKGDIILYCKNDGETACHRVHHVNYIGSIKRYHTKDDNNHLGDEPVYENQIIGKVISDVDNNLWNTISMKIWDISIHNLNVRALFTNH